MEVGSTSGEFRPADEDSGLGWTGEMLFNAQVYKPLKTKNMILLVYLQVGKSWRWFDSLFVVKRWKSYLKNSAVQKAGGIKKLWIEIVKSAASYVWKNALIVN